MLMLKSSSQVNESSLVAKKNISQDDRANHLKSQEAHKNLEFGSVDQNSKKRLFSPTNARHNSN